MQREIEEELEDTKWAIGIRKSKSDRQHNGQICYCLPSGAPEFTPSFSGDRVA